MFRSSTFDKNLENATSHLRLEPDWPSILLICDAIRQNDVSPKQAFQAVKKKMSSPNPHSAYYSLLVLESIVKNCGAPVHEEVFTKENCEMFSSFLEQTPHENVRQKMLELIQCWAYAFRSSEKYQSIKDTMTILKAKGHTFPELKEADAMFTADTAPGWADGKVCHRCRVEFSFTQRKHHCRNCGQIFCAQCSSKQCPLPKYGIEKLVRVCDGCFTSLLKPASGKSRSAAAADSDLPAEYLNSSLAQQAQVVPPRKTEQELKEEEELQLALALSQSEAEHKGKPPQTVNNYRVFQRSPSPEEVPAPVVADPDPIEETPTDPELAKYLNRSYWEQRKATEEESPASPSAPSPMPQQTNIMINKTPGDAEIDDFAINMKSQVEIFVNRMKSNSSRGRSISNDSSVQTLFMNLTSLHSRLLTYIKDMDDKRMWYEQLQDKLAQVKDSRAALDVLRQEHIEKVRRIAEEQERQRQMQMAQKLEIMRKKKQEYLQYQRQLALQRIQEQEREMQMRQEQQKAQYRMGGHTAFPFMPNPNQPPHGSPNHQMNPQYNPYGYNAAAAGTLPRFMPSQPQPNMAAPMPGMYAPGIASPLPNHPGMVGNGPQQNSPLPVNHMGGPGSIQTTEGLPNMPTSPNVTSNAAGLQQQQQPHQHGIPSPIPHGMIPPGQNIHHNPGMLPNNPQQINVMPNMGMNPQMQGLPPNPHPNQQPPIQQNQPPPPQQHQPQSEAPPPQAVAPPAPQPVAPPAHEPANKQNSEEEAPEVTTAELISFD